MQITFNWEAVALATVLSWVLYVLWFSPFVFGGPWQRLEQLSDEGVRAGLLLRLGLAFVASAAQSVCLDGFFNFTRSNNFYMGALAALQLSLCLAVPAGVMLLVMGRRNAGLIGIYLGWLLLSQILCGGLLAAFT
ncbi:MAG TPA: DUF1761 domain-containing protein [bacterium]|jgi:hypothetical protein|nr:DUF1761 domain-containing protein [bacterium]